MLITRKEVGGVALLVGTVIGAGIFGIPYAVQQFGFWPGMAMLAFLALAVGITTLAYADLVLHTRAKTQFAGIIHAYLGKIGYYVGFVTLLAGAYGALLAYTVEIGNLLSHLLEPWATVPPTVLSLLFFACAAVLISLGLKSVTKTEVFFVGLVILIILLFAVVALPRLEPMHFSGSDISMWLLPYGVMLFALPGLSSVPDVVATTGRHGASVRKVIVLGMVLPAVLYALFALSVIGVAGPGTTQSAIVGFGQAIGPAFLWIGSLLGVLTMGTSFLISGLVASELFEFDAKTPKLAAFFLALVPPLIIFLIGQPSFIQVLSTVGSVVMGMLGVLILLAWMNMKRQGLQKRLLLRVPTPVLWGILLVYAAGIGYQFFFLTT